MTDFRNQRPNPARFWDAWRPPEQPVLTQQGKANALGALEQWRALKSEPFRQAQFYAKNSHLVALGIDVESGLVEVEES